MKGLLFTYLATFGGAVAALSYPFAGLLVYICFAVVKPESIWFYSVTPGNYSRIVALALLAGWFLRDSGRWPHFGGGWRNAAVGSAAIIVRPFLLLGGLLTMRRLKEFGKEQGTAAALTAFWLWSVLSAIPAYDQDRAWYEVEELFKIVLPFLVGLAVIESGVQLKILAWVIALSQGYVAFEFNLRYLQGYNWAWEGGYAGLDNNALAIAMVTGVGLAFFLGLGAKRWWAKGVGFAAAGLMLHVVLFSFSRGGMLALAVTGLAAFALIPKRPLYYAIFIVAVLMAGRLAGPEVRDRFWTIFAGQGDRDPSAQSRLHLWADAWDAMMRRPLLGVGPGNWGLVADRYGWEPGKEAHTLWLQTGAETGVPGMMFLMLFYGLCVAGLWPLARSDGNRPMAPPGNGWGSSGVDPWFPDAARMVIASLVGFAVAAQFVSVGRLEIPYYVALLGAGVLKLSSREGGVTAWTGCATGWPARSRLPASAHE